MKLDKFWKGLTRRNIENNVQRAESILILSDAYNMVHRGKKVKI